MASNITFLTQDSLNYSKDVRIYLKNTYNYTLNSVHTCGPYFISISHTKGCYGFALSDCPIGLDIESITRNISKNALKYIYNSLDTKDGMVLWCIKEAAYKLLTIYYKELRLKDIIVQEQVFYQDKILSYYCIVHKNYHVYYVQENIIQRSVLV